MRRKYISLDELGYVLATEQSCSSFTGDFSQRPVCSDVLSGTTRNY